MDAVTDDAPALGDAFPTPTYDQWRGLVDKVLSRGTTVEPADRDKVFARRLTRTTPDGVTLAPLYTSSDELPDSGVPGVAPFVRGSSASGATVGGWDVRQRHADPDVSRGNAAILADLENGVTSLWLKVGPRGVAIDQLTPLLNGVLLELATVVLDADEHYADAASALQELWSSQGLADDAVSGNFGADPIGFAARTGTQVDLAPAVALATTTVERFPGMRAIVVDGLAFHEAGASDSEELGAAIAAGAEYLRAMVAAGIDVDDALGQIEFRFAATADQFQTMAKLRAARRAWARVAEVAGASADASGQVQHAVTSWSMTSRRDPWVNVLRDTVATFAAGTGGANSVTVLPFDAAIGLPDPFARRIARNVQALLIEESNLGRVIDPAGGSWYVESLTNQLAEAAWAFFREIEADGGLVAALNSGLVERRIEATWHERVSRIAHRRDPLTGVSEFPLVDEPILERLPEPAPPSGGLPRRRYAEPFEGLRDRADAMTPHPTVLLATLGPVAAYTGRSTWAKNFFEAGGIRATAVEATADTAADAIASTKASIVCLCSSDAVYATEALGVVAAAKAAGATRIYIAGKAGADADALRAAGVDDFVGVGSDLLTTLSDALDHVGASR